MATTRIISSKQPNKNKGGVVFYGNPGGLGANGLDRSFIGVGLEYAGFHNARMNDIFQQPSTPTRYYIYTKSSIFFNNGIKPFGDMYPENYIMIGVPNRTVGQNPVKQGNIFPTRSNNLNFDIRTRRIVTAGWDEFTGQPLVVPTVSHDSFIRSGSATIDTRPVPGKWNYAAGYKGSGKGAPQNIASQNYSTRNG